MSDQDLIDLHKLFIDILKMGGAFLGLYVLYHLKYTKEKGVRFIICLLAFWFFYWTYRM